MASVLGIFIGVILAIALIGAAGWVAYLHLRARRLGLPPPKFQQWFQSPSSSSSTRDDNAGGVFGFIKRKLPGKKPTPASRGFGPLGNDDGAWDARVDTRGYYEEDAELGLHASPDDEHHPSQRDPRGGGDRPTYAEHWNDMDSPPRGRSRSRSPRFEDAHETLGGAGGGGRGTRDPFSDAHAVEAQPRKSDGFGRPINVKGGVDTPRQSLDVGGGGDRRSIFREQMD